VPSPRGGRCYAAQVILMRNRLVATMQAAMFDAVDRAPLPALSRPASGQRFGAEGSRGSGCWPASYWRPSFRRSLAGKGPAIPSGQMMIATKRPQHLSRFACRSTYRF
jgi:hypothetical protein